MELKRHIHAGKKDQYSFIDLFCGMGGFRLAFEQACTAYGAVPRCVFSSDIDRYCRKNYAANFHEEPAGDIREIDEKTMPHHDILLAGFPCQPFSIIGSMKGMEDTRGTLFFEIARILKEKRPKAFVLENVKQLTSHNQGRTLKIILNTLNGLGYHVYHKVLNALEYGLPQKRERVFLVGFSRPVLFSFPFPQNGYTPLSDLLEGSVDQRFYASQAIRFKRKEKHVSEFSPSIWHENKSGNICSYPYSCALRSGASYNYLLVNGERRLTPKEMLRLQGFPDSYKVIVSDTQLRKQAGNAVPVNMAKAVIENVLHAIGG
jgi:DNA (cytosine-5)-methyltransferase 1